MGEVRKQYIETGRGYGKRNQRDLWKVFLGKRLYRSNWLPIPFQTPMLLLEVALPICHSSKMNCDYPKYHLTFCHREQLLAYQPTFHQARQRTHRLSADQLSLYT